MQLVGETPAPLRHFVFLAVGVERQADDQFCRLPLADEFPDFGKTPVVGFGMDDGQGTGGFRQIVADSASDAFQSEIEAEYDCGAGIHDCLVPVVPAAGGKKGSGMSHPACQS